MGQTVEAVIISGPRKGQILTLDDEYLPAMDAAETAMLNQAIDDVIAGLGRLNATYREGIEAIKSLGEAR